MFCTALEVPSGHIPAFNSCGLASPVASSPWDPPSGGTEESKGHVALHQGPCTQRPVQSLRASHGAGRGDTRTAMSRLGPGLARVSARSCWGSPRAQERLPGTSISGLDEAFLGRRHLGWAVAAYRLPTHLSACLLIPGAPSGPLGPASPGPPNMAAPHTPSRQVSSAPHTWPVPSLPLASDSVACSCFLPKMNPPLPPPEITPATALKSTSPSGTSSPPDSLGSFHQPHQTAHSPSEVPWR